MTFTCRGCKRETRNKDHGAIVSYWHDNGRLKTVLPFCAPADDGCYGPTMYYFLQYLTPEQRRSTQDVVVELDYDEFMQPARRYEWPTLDDMFQDLQRLAAQRPLETIPYCLPLAHYQRRGEELAQQLFV